MLVPSCGKVTSHPFCQHCSFYYVARCKTDRNILQRKGSRRATDFSFTRRFKASLAADGVLLGSREL